MSEAVTEKFVTFSTLKGRGWNEALAASLLGEPDRRVPNPHYRSGPPMKLYALSRVETAEASEAFRQAQAGRSGRVASARRAVQTKRERMLAWAQALQVSVPVIAWDRLVERSIKHYNHFHFESEKFASLGTSSPEFLERLTVNYLRHECSRYDELLEQAFGQVGTGDARRIIRQKVYGVIAATYPHLADECERQTQRREQQENQILLWKAK
jgi:hypothetical protein